MDRVAFIGGDNMAVTIIGGLIASRWAPSRITAVDPNAGQRDRLASGHGVNTTEDMAGTALADIIVPAVKPQVISAVAKQLDADLSGKLILSIAAGPSDWASAVMRGIFWPVSISNNRPGKAGDLIPTGTRRP